MRSQIIGNSAGDFKVRGVAGNHVVLLAFDCSEAYRKDLLGFAIRRADTENGEVVWLRGLKKFDETGLGEGEDVSTRNHPIQKFHWGDYTAKSGRTYEYEIQALTGTPGNLTPKDTLKVTVTCEKPESVGPNGHAVHYNRSAAASQAFALKFPNLPAGDVTDPNARAWLSRGLAEAMIGFIDDVKAGEGLHLFVYEFTKEEFLEALKRAMDRGVKLEIIYDSLISTTTKNGNVKKEGPSLESVPLIQKHGLTPVCRGRDGAGINISHNKFMIHTDAAGKPVAVWTGSTNFTDNGIYGQSNVGHIVRDSGVAGQYLEWHQLIWNAPSTAVAPSRKEAMRISAMPLGSFKGTRLILSPRDTIEAITELVTCLGGGKHMICFTAPFQLHDDLEKALVAAPAQVYGLLNKDGVVGKEMHEAPNTMLASAGAINQKSVLEQWQGHLHAESLHHSGVFIHTKIVLIDPLSDSPTVIVGSANFSNNSCKNNDENQLFITDETEVADVYLGEFMRMFDHYYFREHVKDMERERKLNPKAGFLDPTAGWTDIYFNGGNRMLERQAYFV